MKILLTLLISLLLSNSAFGQANPYIKPTEKVGGAIASGIEQGLIKRGFAANDPRIGNTIAAVSKRVPVLTAAAGSGATWLRLIARLSPYATAALLVAEGLRWFFKADGTVESKKDSPAVVPGAINAGQKAYYSDNAGGGIHPTIEQAFLAVAYIKAPSATANSIAYSQSSVGRWLGYVMGSTSANGQQVNLFGYSSVYVSETIAVTSCPINYYLNGGQCVAIPWPASYYDPQPQTKSHPSPQAAFDDLPSAAKNSPLSEEILSDIANRLWRDAASQPGFDGVPFSTSQPVSPPDFAPHKSSHPEDWPQTSELNNPAPTFTSSVADPTPNPNQVTPNQSSPMASLGPDPGVTEPAIPDTPTDIFQPVIDLFSDWTHFSVPQHNAACPTFAGSVVVAGHAFDVGLTQHCPLIEQHRSELQVLAMLIWLITAAFIVLSA